MESFVSLISSWAPCIFAVALPCLMLPRGGHQMKRKFAAAQPANTSSNSSQPFTDSQSALGTGLLLRWADGQMSAKDVQELADLAIKSGATHPEVAWLVKMGGSGTSDGGHCSRDLYRKFLKDLDVPKPYFIKVPVYKSKDRDAIVEIDLPLLLPHDWFFHLHKGYPDKFQEAFGIENVPSWWSQQKISNPKMFQHPMLDKNWKEAAVPFVLHGDGAQFHDRDNLCTVSMKPLLFSGETNNMRKKTNNIIHLFFV